SPAVRRLAAEPGLDLSRVSGSGATGRVPRRGVLRHLEGRPPAETAAPPPPPPRAAPAAAPPPGEGEPVRLSATRRAIARHMSEAHATIPVAWMAVEADVSGLVELRRRARDDFEEAHGLRLTFMPFFVQAIARTLREHPALNASYSEEGVLRHERLDMGIAVATDSGLLVPVLRAAGSKFLAELSRELQDLAERARARTLTREELVGATLTIDNTGAFGSLVSQPIVPLGQVAIVTTEAIRRELRVVPGDDGGDAFAPRSVMNLAISFDHRALDGAEAGAFMAALKSRLEAIAPDDPLEAGA
ncbi:MAG: 2-oxo acid dehydrogenase subunit E2, partial [Chloroflexi bacterium]|nr:2-oxo acid dehydrogenase subunit E2 [Chloroflexota bacterium]